MAAIWKYIPPRIGIFDGKTFHPNAPVTTVILHPPTGGGVHPKTAIRGDWHLAEIITPFGTSTRGFADGYVTPRMKFAVKLGPGQERDEVIAKWKNAPPKSGAGNVHSTVKRDNDLMPTAEARRQVQTIRHREEFPEILTISMRVDGTNYLVKVPDPKNKRGYDLVDVLVHNNGARSIKSASRSRITPERASKIVTKYLVATR